MRKITLVLILLSFSFALNAQTYLQENFDTEIPTTWTITDGGAATGDSWISGQQGGANNLDGTNGAVVDSDANGNGTLLVETLTSPAFDTTGAVGLYLDFDQYYNNLGADSAIVEVFDGTTWNEVLNQTASNGAFGAPDQQHIDITAYSNANLQVRFIYDDANEWAWYWMIDNFHVYNSLCNAPTTVTISNIGELTADVNWAAGGTETAWEIVVQNAGTGTPTAPGTATTTNPYNVTALSASSAYEVYLLADCGGTDGQSIWTGPFNFTTLNTAPPTPTGVTCASGSSIMLFTETFGTDANTNPSGWTGTGFDGSNGNWDITNAGANSGGTGPANAYDGGTGMHLEYEASGDSSTIASAISPAIDLTTATDGAELAFFMHAFGADMGTLNVNIGTTATGPFTTEYTWIGDYQSSDSEAWIQIGIDLTAYLGQVIYLEFSYGAAGTGWEGDMSIDQITIETCGNFCIAPTNLTASNITSTSADISWDANNGETAWEIVIQPDGTGVPTGAGTVTTSNPYNATSLTPSTVYEAYILADCTTNGQSVWAGPISFTTLNTPPPAPTGVTCASGPSTTLFTEDFGTDANTDPSGWTGTGFDGSNGNWDITNAGANSTGTGPGDAYDGGTGMHLEYEASGDSSTIASAISPAIDLTTALDGAELAFFMHAFGADMGTLNVNVGTSATGPFTTEYTWVGDYQTTDTEAWVPIGIDLSTYLGQVIYLEFSYGGAGTGFEGDISIDQITVETCGDFCVAPTNLTASNITGTTADITWTANNGETEWQYVLQPAGTGVPTGAGTIITTTTLNATVLSYSTDYEVYILADCGLGSTSVYAGPLNFSTTVQTNFVVDCTSGPTNFTYCYGPNDTNLFTFVSSDGVTPLNFTINAGQVENGWDELVVYDTDGTTDLNNATPYGNNGDLSGITYQSTGNTMSFGVQSDGSGSCSTSGYTSIDITVSCATCINPAASYIVIDDCANGDQFLVNVDITSLGDATSLLIEDNQGTTGVSVTTTGITTFGPYPFLTDIIFTVSNEQDTNCIITSPAIQLAACPPENDNCANATVAVVNDNFLCEFTTLGTLQEASDSGMAAASCGGASDDDVWFQFTALTEFQLITLANLQGSETFNIDMVLYEGTCGTLVEIDCFDAFPAADITPQLTIGDTYFIQIFSGGTDAETTTFDLCITPYIIPTNITCADSENFCPAGNTGGALYVSNVIDMPNGTSVACLGSIPNPTYSVLEIGNSGDILVEIVQSTAFDINENAIGNTLDVDYVLWGPFSPGDDYCSLNLEVDCPTCPNNTTDPNFYPFGNIADCSYSGSFTENFTLTGAVAGDIYLILVTNYANDPGIIQISQTNLTDATAGELTSAIAVDLISTDAIFNDDDSDPTTPSIANLCGYNSIVLEADSPFADSYEWSINGILQAGLTTDSITVTESNTYSVTVYDDQCSGFAQQTVIVNLFKSASVNVVQPNNINIITCDDASGDGTEDFNLENLSPSILDVLGQDPSDFVVTYHDTLNDAQSGTNSLVSPYSAVDGTVIYVRVEDVDAVGSGSGCASTNTSFTLIVLGALPNATGVDMNTCDDNSRDGLEYFDLDANDTNILDGQDPVTFQVSYYANELDAEAGTNALVSPYENTSNPQTIYSRVENTTASDCYAVAPFDLIVDDVPFITIDEAYQVCPNATVPITLAPIANNFDDADVTITWYYENALITGENNLNLATVLEAGAYTVEATFIATGCVSTTNIVVTELATCVIPQGISPNGDLKNDTFDLSSFDVQSLEVFNRNGTLVYSKVNYLDEWHGQSKDGEELPVGTYYYVMKYQGNKTKASWVYINRAN